MGEKELIRFLEELTPADFSRIIARRRRLSNHLPGDKSHLERVTALVDHVRSVGGPGMAWLIGEVNELFPDAGPYCVDKLTIQTTTYCSAPPLPQYFVARPDIMDRIKSPILSDAPTAPGILLISALHGQGGIGKSTLAIALAHDPEIQTRFPDGIFWASLGQEPNLLSLLSAWIQELYDYDFKPTNINTATTHLCNLFRSKAALLIVDDAWDAAHVQAFRAGGARCRMLITTRRADIAESVGAKLFSLDALTPVQSLELLAARLGRPLEDSEQQDALSFAKLVGYLPLALELAAGRVAWGISWHDLIQALNQEVARLEQLESVRPRTRGETQLEASFNISLKALRQYNEDAWKAFIWLGVLPEDVLITAPMAANIWKFGVQDSENILELLWNDSLLLRGQPVQIGTHSHASYRLHDILHDIARRHIIKPEPVGFGLTLEQAHETILERYKLSCLRSASGQSLWHTVFNDGYSHAHLTWHMLKAESTNEIDKLLQEETTDGRNAWYTTCNRLRRTAGFLQDISRAESIEAEKNSRQLISTQTTDRLGYELRYALIKASISSLVARIPLALIKLLFADGIWTSAQALAFISQIPGRQNQVEVLCQLVPLLVKSEQMETLRKTLEVAKAVSDNYYRTNALIQVASALAQIGESDQALEIAKAVSDNYYRTNALIQVASALAQIGESDQALEIAKTISSERSREDALIKIVAQITGPQLLETLQKALEIAYTISNKLSRANVLRQVAYTLAQTGENNKALEIAKTISDDYYRARALRQVASSLAQAGEINKALEVTSTISVDLCRTNALIQIASQMTGSQRIEMLQKALEVTNTISDVLCRINALRQLASSLAQAGDASKALEVAKAIPEHYRVNVFTQIASSLAQAGEINKALEVVKAIPVYHQTNALHQVISSLAQAGETNKALEVANTIPEHYRAGALTQVAGQITGSQRIETLHKALEAANTISDEHLRANALTHVASFLVQSGEANKALEVANAIPEHYRNNILRQVISLLVQSGETNNALEVASNISEVLIRSNALTQVATSLAQAGETSKALEVANTIPERYRADPLIQIASQMSGSQRIEIFQKAIEVAKAISNKQSRMSALTQVATSLAQAGETNKALEATNAISDEYSCTNALLQIASQMTGSQQIETLYKALKVAKAIPDDTSRMNALAQVASSLAQAGETNKALEVAKAIPDDMSRTSALIQVASSLAQAGETNNALEAANAISDDYSRANALSQVASSLAQAGETNKALEVANTIPKHYRADALTQVASSLAQAGETNKALKVAKAIPDDTSRMNALAQVSSSLAQAGETNKALEVAKAIPDDMSRTSALIQVASSLAQAGETNNALEAANAISDECCRADALIQIAAQSTGSQRFKTFHKALEVASTISDERSRANVLRQVAFYLAQAKDRSNSLGESTEHIPLKSSDDISILQLVVEHDTVTKYTLAIAKTIQNTTLRLHVSHSLRQVINRETSYELWWNILQQFSNEKRSNLLEAIPKLIELTASIQEPTFVVAVATSIRDVTRWWP